MEKQTIQKVCENAIKGGFVNYFICPNFTWGDLKDILIEGSYDDLSLERKEGVEYAVNLLNYSKEARHSSQA